MHNLHLIKGFANPDHQVAHKSLISLSIAFNTSEKKDG